MNAVIIANGQFAANARLITLWQGADLRIAADGGSRNAHKYLELAPLVAIGDFDSLDEAIASRDFPVIQAVVLTTAAIVAVVNLSVDCVYAFIDPRIRYVR